MINIVLFGAPGCGKGTQAALLREQFGIEHVSTGEVIRGHIRRGTELGKAVQACIERGELAPDELVINMIADYVAEHKDSAGCIFDGFPRTTAQAVAFDKILADNGLQVDLMVQIKVEESELIRRILLRGKESGRADDSSEEVIRQRLEVYWQQTAVVADHYAAQNKYNRIDGMGTIEEVNGRIKALIEAIK
ncbi:MAG: adenylate kinase [Alistipes sp.]|nr:adenylate kinase [Alistipes sp.]MBQ5718077.1 adenylate kinase [Alistipes sp.]MBR0331202.1 adenylate kinase [Alistipes sp.]